MLAKLTEHDPSSASTGPSSGTGDAGFAAGAQPQPLTGINLLDCAVTGTDVDGCGIDDSSGHMLPTSAVTQPRLR